MVRVDVQNRSIQQNTNILFNMIQACRTDLELLQGQIGKQDKRILDTDLIHISQALTGELKKTFITLEERLREESH